MSKSAPPSQKKRKLEDGMRGKIQKPRKKIRKQKNYHSSSEDEDGDEIEFPSVNLNDSDEEHLLPESRFTESLEAVRKKSSAPVLERSQRDQLGVAGLSGEENESEKKEEENDDDENEDDSDDEDHDDSDSQSEHDKERRKPSKRNDPEAFSTSMSKILSTKLSRSAREDPVLSRSKEAAEASSSIANNKLEQRARAKIRAEKKEELERGRIKDVRGLESGDSGRVAEEEKRLRKIAQRGVVKLFNAVRAAQVRGEQAAREERRKGTVGMAHREEKVNEMSKQGFLELISGKIASAAEVEEV